MTERQSAPGGELVGKALRFGLVGATCAAIYAVATIVQVSFLGVEERLASAVGYLLAVPVNFLANRSFSFRSNGAFFSDLARFVGLHAANMALAALLMGLAVDWLGFGYTTGIAVTVLLIPPTNFLLMNFWVFRLK